MPVEAAPLARAVGIAGAVVVGVVAPFALKLPRRAIGEGRRRNVEGPRALVTVLLPLRVIPRSRAGRIAAGFAQLVGRHVGQRGQTLAVAGGGVLRIAAGVSVEAEEEAELHPDAVHRAG